MHPPDPADPSAPAPRSADGVLSLLGASAFGGRRVGLELETGVLRASDGTPARFDGPDGIEALLARLRDEGGPWQEEVRERGRLVALRGGGASLTLEPGGQLELSTRARRDLCSLAAEVREGLARMARVAEDLDLWLVGGGLQPAHSEQVPWMPKARYAVMREYFARLGDAGRLAHTMMQRTLSVQVSLDFVDAEDAAELLRLAFWAAAPATAMFAASPFDGDDEAGVLSLRAMAWRRTDPARSGEVAGCARPESTLRDWVDYALDVPMMFRIRGEEYLPQHGASFRRVLEAGRWDDGARVTVEDLWNHMSGIFTDARIKRGLVELRSTDGQLPGDVLSVPAFWVGLLYDARARREAAELLRGPDANEREEALEDVGRFALSASWGGRPMIDVARGLLEVARGGLERRVASGEEAPEALAFLAPLERRLRQGRTPAEELLEAWRGPWRRRRERLVEALRFRP